MSLSGPKALSRRVVISAALAGLGVVRSKPARAGSLRFDPVILELPPGRMATVLVVANGGAESTVIQARAFAWSQQGDEDLLAPTPDLIISPPISTVDAQDEQVVRLLLRRPHDVAERHYRMLVEEVPSTSTGHNEVAVAINASLPIIVAGTAPGKAELAWEVQGLQGRQIVLLARNSGTQCVRINQLNAVLFGEHRILGRPVARNPFVLPGMERSWLLPLPPSPARPGRLQLTADTSVGPSTAELAFTL